MNRPTVHLIDGSGLVYRSYYARRGEQPRHQQSDGIPTDVVMMFSGILDKLLRDTASDYVAVVFDAARGSFRGDIYPAYKANRPPRPANLTAQLNHVRQAVDAFSVCRIQLDGFEADDLIATYARHAVEAGADVRIVSSDKDFMQLIGPHVKMLDPINYREIGEVEVREKFGVTPDKVIDVQALCGDRIDNVPGVPGIGIKIAASLISTYGDLETLLARAREIKRPMLRQMLIVHADQARLSRELVRLENDVPIPCPLSALAAQPYDPATLFPFLDEMGLTVLKQRIRDRMNGSAASSSTRPFGYRDRVEVLRDVGSIDVGYWMVRIHSRAPRVPAMIMAREPDDLDQRLYLAALAGRDCDPFEVMACKDRGAISKDEYLFQVADMAWTATNEPDDPRHRPREPVDRTKLPLSYFDPPTTE